jgi:hypothetical protein
VSFGGATIPEDCVARTFRVKVMSSPAKQRRAKEMLVAAGDTWAWTIDRFHRRRRADSPGSNSASDLWPEIRAHGSFGELTMHCAQDVAKCCSASQVGQRELVPRSSTAKKAMPASSGRYLTASRVDARIHRAVLRFWTRPESFCSIPKQQQRTGAGSPARVRRAGKNTIAI